MVFKDEARAKSLICLIWRVFAYEQAIEDVCAMCNVEDYRDSFICNQCQLWSMWSIQ